VADRGRQHLECGHPAWPDQQSNRQGILADLESLPFSIDWETRKHTWGRTLELADLHRLTVYDATYLELALRLFLPLDPRR
jgi:predicted nucleic acid-binding protein